MRTAIYRIHYGLDFLEQSIESIRDAVDLVIVYFSRYPWCRTSHVTYLGKQIHLPDNPENVESFLEDRYGDDPKVIFDNFECQTPKNQFRLLYEDSVLKIGRSINTLLFMEPDMVFFKPDVERLLEEFEKMQVAALGTYQTELWKTPEYRIPQRNRIGPTCWNIDLAPDFTTHFGTYLPEHVQVHEGVTNYNFGFCLNAETMLYKHLTALVFSEKIGDSIPSQEWYRDKWVNWTPETTNLEIAENWKHLIPRAEPFCMPAEMYQQLSDSDGFQQTTSVVS